MPMKKSASHASSQRTTRHTEKWENNSEQRKSRENSNESLPPVLHGKSGSMRVYWMFFIVVVVAVSIPNVVSSYKLFSLCALRMAGCELYVNNGRAPYYAHSVSLLVACRVSLLMPSCVMNGASKRCEQDKNAKNMFSFFLSKEFRRRTLFAEASLW